MSTQIWDRDDFFIGKTGNDEFFEEKWGFSRDPMMLGKYKYDAFCWLRDSVFSHL